MENVYFDHAATTAPDQRVLEAMYPYLEQHFGNAHSPHKHGRKANGAVESARSTIAEALGCENSEVVFTSGGTESNNAIIKGIAQRSDKTEIISSSIEHKAVLKTVEHCESLGMKPVFLSPRPDGSISAEQVEEAITDDTALVSLMLVNNELGTVNPISEIGQICRQHEIPFHTDAVQAMGKLDIDVDTLNVDFLSVSGHKIHAPKGIGFMYIRKNTPWRSWMHGGTQESNRRAGTLNVPGIVAISAAIDQCIGQRTENEKHLQKLHHRLIDGLDDRFGDQYQLNGPSVDGSRVPHILNLSFFRESGGPVDGEMLLMNLDMEGICASSGSACASGAVEPSHVLQGIGLDREEAQSAVRLSMGKDNTTEQIDYTLDALEKIMDRI